MQLSQNKKGIHGIGILIIFMAVILMSTGISILVLTSANKMSQEGRQSYNEVADNSKFLQIVSVAGYDGRDQTLSLITVDVKLLADSVPMYMEYLSVALSEPDFKSILHWRGDLAPVVNNNLGYNTWTVQEFDELTYGNQYLLDIDLDDDGLDDYLFINSTHVMLNISSREENTVAALGKNLSTGSVTFNDIIPLQGPMPHPCGELIIQGTTSGADIIDEELTFEFTPYKAGNGYYVSEHLIRDKKSMNGYIVPGDVVRFYIEPYEGINVDEIISVQFFYRDMETVNKQIFVGNTFPSKPRVELFPMI